MENHTFLAGGSSWLNLVTYSLDWAQMIVHTVWAGPSCFASPARLGASPRHDFITPLHSWDRPCCSPLPQLHQTPADLPDHRHPSSLIGLLCLWLCSSQSPHPLSKHLLGATTCKQGAGCPEHWNERLPALEELTGIFLGWRWGWIKPSLCSGVGSDAGAVSMRGTVGAPLRAVYTLSLFLPPTLLSRIWLLRRGLMHSGPHLSHLWIPQVLTNTTHLQSPTGWYHFLYCCGLNYFSITFCIHWLVFSTG